MSSATYPVGEGTLFVQWRVDDGSVALLQLDAPVEEDLSTATTLPAVEAMVNAGLGLGAKESAAFVKEAVSTAVAEASDPLLVETVVQRDGAEFTLNAFAGSGTFAIDPS